MFTSSSKLVLIAAAVLIALTHCDPWDSLGVFERGGGISVRSALDRKWMRSRDRASSVLQRATKKWAEYRRKHGSIQRMNQVGS